MSSNIVPVRRGQQSEIVGGHVNFLVVAGNATGALVVNGSFLRWSCYTPETNERALSVSDCDLFFVCREWTKEALFLPPLSFKKPRVSAPGFRLQSILTEWHVYHL
jgi:hypothetical protein